jgi:hypothetical protein
MMLTSTTFLYTLASLFHLSQSGPVEKRSPQDIGPASGTTSTYFVQAAPWQVVNSDNAYTGGLEGAYAEFTLNVNSRENTICYNITLTGFSGDYQSPAITATHLHEAGAGTFGPPRIAFVPNPDGPADGARYSIGCLTGPFETGILNDEGVDTGRDFGLSEIEHYPGGFYVDIHSSYATDGAVRGQLS